MPFHKTPPGMPAPEYTQNLPDPLVVAILDGPMEKEGRTTAVVTSRFFYEHRPSKAVVEVPEGYITDFASIPAVVRGSFPPFGRHAKAAVLHDWIYAIGQPGLKAFADRIFLDAMVELDVSAARRNLMYQAVKLGGGGGYDRAAEWWKDSFGDWRSGERSDPPKPREAYFTEHWLKPPDPAYRP